jgi:two-component system, OmpR family, sensor histidine kinase KdpD
MPTSTKRRTPEELLRQVQAEEAYEKRGRLKVFLGYASGVGKSFRMLDEGRRRAERGQDVLVGAVQPHRPPEIEALLSKLRVIPLRSTDGSAVMDVDGILARHPGVCLVDGLAYDNPPGSRNSSRWQDVDQLLDAGISVISSVNIQYIDELRERVSKITGKVVTQTVPAKFLSSADEIVVVDAPPEMCIRTQDSELDARANSQAQKLSELREIALLFAADVVDQQLEQYLQRNGITQTFGAQERIMVCITPRANAAAMIASGRRNAERFHGDLTVAYVRQPEISADDQAALDRNLAIARDAKAHIEILDGEDPIETILLFARDHGITQVFVGHSTHEHWWERVTGTPLDRLIRDANDIDVRVFPH